MPIDPQNVLKGRMLEGLLATAFRRAKYTVVPLGVEHQFPDIDELTVRQHVSLLPVGLRRLPDLMVYRWEGDEPKVFFLEAKFRSRLTSQSVASLKNTLSQQAELWEDTYCVLALAEQATTWTGSEYQQNYMRVFRADAVDHMPDDPSSFWTSTQSLDQLFPEFESYLKRNPLTEEVDADYAREMEPLLDDAVKILRALGSITPRDKK